MSTSVNLPGRAKDSLSEHKKIVQVVVGREGELAERYAREHIRNVKKAVLQSFEKKTKRLSV